MAKNHRRAVAATLALLAAGAGCGGGALHAAARVPRAVGWTWSAVDAGPIAEREGVAAGADDRWLVAWGGISGSGADAVVRDDGAVYDSTTRSWAPMPPAPLSARHDAAAVWAGGRLYIVGGSSSPNPNGVGDLRDGASFEPATGLWRSIDPIGDSFQVRIDRSCRQLTEARGRLWTTCAWDGGHVPAWRDQWTPMDVPTTPVPASTRLVALDGKEVLVTPLAGTRRVGRLRAEVSLPTGWSTSVTSVPVVRGPAGVELGIDVASTGTRVAVATSSLDRLRWFDPVPARWRNGPVIPPPPVTTGIGATPSLATIDDHLLLLTPGQDLSLVSGRWERIDRPPDSPAVWSRWAPITTPTGLYLVGEPATPAAAGAVHTLHHLTNDRLTES